jgi:hypothetical protein
MRGQVGLEYLVIIGFFFLLVGILTDYYNRVSSERSATVITRASLDNFKQSSDRVFALGVPAAENVRVSLPESINESRTGLLGQGVQISFHDQHGELVDIACFFEYNVSGTFPNSSGNYDLVVYSIGAAGVGVNIS